MFGKVVYGHGRGEQDREGRRPARAAIRDVPHAAGGHRVDDGRGVPAEGALHLRSSPDEDAPGDANERFFAFLEEEAPGADALYILGDLFEYWIGDDDLDEPFNAIVAGFCRR